jgi:hypothetical protein
VPEIKKADWISPATTLRFKVGDAALKPFYETDGRDSVYYLHVTWK